MRRQFLFPIQQLSGSCFMVAVATMLILPTLDAAEVKKNEVQKSDTQIVVQKVAETDTEPAQQTAEIKKSDVTKEEKKASAGFYFYPSSSDQAAPGNEPTGSQDASFENTSLNEERPTDNGVAYVPLTPNPPAGASSDVSPDLSIPPGIEKGTSNSKLDEWLSRHPDVKERMQKQQEMINAQIKENQMKLEGQLKNSSAADGGPPVMSGGDR